MFSNDWNLNKSVVIYYSFEKKKKKKKKKKILVALSRTRLAGEQGEIRTGSQIGFQLCRLPVRPGKGQGQTHTRVLAGLNQDSNNTVWPCVPCPAVHVPHRSTHSNRKTSSPGLAPYEAHTVAFEEQLEGTRVARKGDTSPQVAPPSLKMVTGGKQCASRSTITPTKTCSADHQKKRGAPT